MKIMTRSEYQNFLASWYRGTDTGDGFPVGGDDNEDNLFCAIEADGDTVAAAYPYRAPAADSTRYRFFLAIATRPDGSQYVVCDSNGPVGVNL